jgi:hypothetical protein
MDFFEKPPGREAQCRVNKLLEWWSRCGVYSNFNQPRLMFMLFRKVFGRSRHGDLSNTVKASISVNALARQRAQLDDAAFDSN